MDRLEIERAIDLTETMCGLHIEGPNRKISMFLSLRQHLVDTLAHLDEVCSAYSVVLDHATGGQMSKPYLDTKMVCSVIDDAQNEHVNTYISEAVEQYQNKIKELEHQLGMTNISLGHKTTLLESCEKALSGRDDKIENARELIDHIQLHTEDPHALHFAQMASNWLSGDSSELKSKQN